MKPIRVLVVDDSVVVRRLVSEALAGEPDIDVVGTAPNGRVALGKLGHLRPDVVVLDVEMPELDGIATLPLLRDARPDLHVIMFSTLTDRGAAVTLEALSIGASDYVTKPVAVNSDDARQFVRTALGTRMRALCRPLQLDAASGRAAPPAPPGAGKRRTRRAPVDLVVIGTSTGGPRALAQIVSALPVDLPVPVLVAQHMPAVFTRHLAGRLDAVGRLRVREATSGLVVRAGDVALAPGGRHLVVHGAVDGGVVVELDDGPAEHSCKPAVDPLFRSAARVSGTGVLAVVLTGMGHDGLLGAHDVIDGGGRVVVQDDATSVVWGMPGAIHRAGIADAVLPLDGVATEIVRRVARGRSHELAAAGSDRS